jgi:uncharacterized coiled-coil DUF342 family protein
MKKLLSVLLITSCTLFLSCEDTNSQLFNIMLEIKAQNDKLINEVKDLQSKSDLLISELRASAAKQQELLEKVTDLQKQLTTILTQIGLLNQELKNQNADLQKVRTQLADLQSKYQTIVEELVELRKLSLVLSEIEKLKLQLNKLDQQYVTISANMIDNKAKLDALRIQITAIQNQIAESLNRISQLTSLLSNQGVDIKSILSQISLLKDKIDELKTDLSNLIKGMSPKIGDNFQGGVIIHLFQKGESGYVDGEQHGIISSTIDQTLNSNSSYYPGETGCMWQNGIYNSAGQTTIFNLTNANGTALGSGGKNTNLILAVSQQTKLPFPAATLARQYNGGGFKDWSLPSKDELYKQFQHKNKIGGFANSW